MRHSRLVDRGTELMLIWLEREVTDARGNTYKLADLDSDPIRVMVNVSTDRQSNAELAGQVDVKVLNGSTRSMPEGSYARILFRDEEWDLAIPLTHHRLTKALSHVEFKLRSRNREEL